MSTLPNAVIVYVELLGENVVVMRPTQGRWLHDDVFVPDATAYWSFQL